MIIIDSAIQSFFSSLQTIKPTLQPLEKQKLKLRIFWHILTRQQIEVILGLSQLSEQPYLQSSLKQSLHIVNCVHLIVGIVETPQIKRF